MVDNIDLIPDEFVESFTEVVTKTKTDELKKALRDLNTQIEAYKAEGKEAPQELLKKIPGAHLEIGPQTLQVR